MQQLIDIVDGVLTEARFRAAQAKRDNGPWIPACGGTETAFRSRSGHLLLYCFQATTGKHAYLNVETDIIMSDDEARASLGTF